MCSHHSTLHIVTHRRFLRWIRDFRPPSCHLHAIILAGCGQVFPMWRGSRRIVTTTSCTSWGADRITKTRAKHLGFRASRRTDRIQKSGKIFKERNKLISIQNLIDYYLVSNFFEYPARIAQVAVCVAMVRHVALSSS